MVGGVTEGVLHTLGGMPSGLSRSFRRFLLDEKNDLVNFRKFADFRAYL